MPTWTTQHSRGMLLAGIAILLTLLYLAPVRAARPLDWRVRAREHEKRGQWLEACRCYEELLRKDRNHAPTREAYLRCLRRVHLATRHRDPSYHQAVARLAAPQALSLYSRVLDAVADLYVDRPRTDPTTLFGQGVRELRFALDDEAFRRQYLAGLSPSALGEFKARLDSWPTRRLATSRDASARILEVLKVAWELGLPRNPVFISAVAMEFTSGACNALDEHSAFVSPRTLAALQGALRGRLAGVGIEVSSLGDRLLISRVYSRSPAQEAGLQRNDRIVRIDRVAVERLPIEVVAERLRGEPGSSVDVEVLRGGDSTDRKVIRLVRRPVVVQSVEAERDTFDPSMATIRINYFTETTAQEVRDALAPWLTGMEPVRGVILDLRGNPGGTYLSAVGVAELFLTEGNILHVQSPLRAHSRSHRVMEPGLAAHLRMVVLVDGETASAAEILASALKELRSEKTTILVGQTTFGKGTIQFFVQTERTALEKIPGGIRITAGRFYSPSHQPISGVGVTPHVLLPIDEDALGRAKIQLRDLLYGPPPSRPSVAMMPPAPPTS